MSDGSQQNLKIIDINVEEQSTGEISAGAGIGTSGGTLVLGIKEIIGWEKESQLHLI